MNERTQDTPPLGAPAAAVMDTTPATGSDGQMGLPWKPARQPTLRALGINKAPGAPPRTFVCSPCGCRSETPGKTPPAKAAERGVQGTGPPRREALCSRPAAPWSWAKRE